MKTRLGLFALCVSAWTALAVGLAWDPSPDTSVVVGYAIYYGTNSGSYQDRVDVGAQTNCTITVTTNGATYFFVATAYTIDGVESLPSNEVSYTPSWSNTNPPAITWKPSATFGDVTVSGAVWATGANY